MPFLMIPDDEPGGYPILRNGMDEEYGEEIVALFVSHVNASRQAAGLEPLTVGSLANAHTPWRISREVIQALQLALRPIRITDKEKPRANPGPISSWERE